MPILPILAGIALASTFPINTTRGMTLLSVTLGGGLPHSKSIGYLDTVLIEKVENCTGLAGVVRGSEKGPFRLRNGTTVQESGVWTLYVLKGSPNECKVTYWYPIVSKGFLISIPQNVVWAGIAALGALWVGFLLNLFRRLASTMSARQQHLVTCLDSLHTLPQGRSTLAYHCTICLCTDHTSSPTASTWCHLQCGHYFHFSCLKTWLTGISVHTMKLTCPICRQMLSPVSV